jgi:DNA (cytosine-5)-methyltransferase 1
MNKINNYKILKNKKKTDINSIELFCGAGGMALGMYNSGINTEFLVDNDKNCIKTLIKNKPNWNIIHSNVRDLCYKNLSGVDVISGGFPCQSFSTAGKRNGFNDKLGNLFFEMSRCISEVMPKIVVCENVRGLINHDSGETLKHIISTLEKIGYNVEYRLIKCQYFDVPQKRERIIIFAIRDDLDITFSFPNANDYTISLREALENVPKSNGQNYSDFKLKIMEKIPPGGYWKDLPLKIQKEYMGKSFNNSGGKTGIARRLSWDDPSLTLTCSPAQKQTERCHPDETRPLTIREYARIQTFPDNWFFEGSISSQYKQIGNAVPVNLGYHIGCSIIKMINN